MYDLHLVYVIEGQEYFNYELPDFGFRYRLATLHLLILSQISLITVLLHYGECLLLIEATMILNNVLMGEVAHDFDFLHLISNAVKILNLDLLHHKNFIGFYHKIKN